MLEILIVAFFIALLLLAFIFIVYVLVPSYAAAAQGPSLNLGGLGG